MLNDRLCEKLTKQFIFLKNLQDLIEKDEADL